MVRCAVCFKELKTYRRIVSITRGYKHKVVAKRMSEEGVLMEEFHRWFCNDCWKQIISGGDDELVSNNSATATH
jgi:hypothetical protein